VNFFGRSPSRNIELPGSRRKSSSELQLGGMLAQVRQDRKNERVEQRQLARRNAASRASTRASTRSGGGRSSDSRVSTRSSHPGHRAVCPANCEFLATTVGQLAARYTANTKSGEKDWKTTGPMGRHTRYPKHLNGLQSQVVCGASISRLVSAVR
jgi:hypothetical protein